MTNNSTERELSKAELARMTLEDKFNQDAFGSDQVRDAGTYGSLLANAGEHAYSDVMDTERAIEIKKGIYDAKNEKRQKLGIRERAPATVPYEVSEKVAEAMAFYMDHITLGDYYDIVKSISGDLGFSGEVPEDMLSLSRNSIIEKVKTSGRGLNQLTPEERIAIGFFNDLDQTYGRGCAVNAVGNNYFADINSNMEERNKAYKALKG